MIRFTLLSLILLLSFSLKSQKDSLEKRFKFFGFPVAFYAPETKIGVGVTSMFSFKFKNDSLQTRRQNVQLGFAYTQLKQVLVYMPIQLWLKNEAYNIYGDIGYYKYNFNYWGIGNSKQSQKERYDLKYPHIRISALKRLKKYCYAGIRYSYDNIEITRTDSAGELRTGLIEGSKGGLVSSLAMVFKCDSRDNIWNASNGQFIEVWISNDSKFIGSDFKFSKFSIEYTTYFKLAKNQVLALNYLQQNVLGNTPFLQLPNIGGAKKMRGYYEGRYRDNNVSILQAEYRLKVYKRAGAVAFADIGTFSKRFGDLAKVFKFTYGGGLRFVFDKKQNINLRADIGIAEGKPNYYFTIAEAF